MEGTGKTLNMNSARIANVITLASPNLHFASTPTNTAQLSSTPGSPTVVTLNTAAWTAGLLTTVHKLWKENVLCDTNIKCLNNETVTAHSLVLSASSPFLKNFFSKARQGLYTLKMDTVPASLWKHLLEFLYTGCLQLPVNQLFPLYNVVKKLQINSLETLCESYIQGTITGTAKTVISNGTPHVSVVTPNGSQVSPPGPTVFISPQSASNGTLQPLPLMSLDQSINQDGDEAAQVLIKQEPLSSIDPDASVGDSLVVEKVTGGRGTRGRSSTTTPESGVYSFSNQESVEAPIQQAEEGSEITPGSHGDQDWNQVKLQNVRSLRTPEIQEQEMEGVAPATNDDANGLPSPPSDTSVDIFTSGNTFNCEPCNRTFKNAHGLKLHRYSCPKAPEKAGGGRKYYKVGKMFKCKICSKVFRCYTSMWCHIKFHTGEGLLTCDVCQLQFASQQLLQRHEKKHHILYKTKLKITKNAIVNNAEVQEKAVVGTNEVVEKPEEGTGKEGEEIVAATEEKEDKHDDVLKISGAVPLACHFCNKHFLTNAELKKHEAKEHKEDKATMFICNTCGRKFNSVVIYRIHMDTHHEQDLRTCKVCKQVFRSAKAMYSHSRVHKAGGSQARPPTPTTLPDLNTSQSQQNGDVKKSPNIEGAEPPLNGEESTEVIGSGSGTVVSSEAGGQLGLDLTNRTPWNAVVGEDMASALKVKLHDPYAFDGDSTPTPPPANMTSGAGLTSVTNTTSEKKEPTVPPLILPRKTMRMRSGGSRKVFRCKQCGKQFRKQGMLAIHMSVHSLQSPHSCKLCGRQFAHRGALTRHKPKCSAQYGIPVTMRSPSHQSESLQQDQLPVENGTTPHESVQQPNAQIDENAPMDLSATSTYSATPTANVPPVNVNASMSDRPTRRSVEIKGNDQPVDRSVPTYECSHCHMVFSGRKQLYHHTCMDAQGNLIKKVYTCKVCFKQFQKSTEFRQHIRVHSKVHTTRKYECTDCGKRFISKGARETHMYTHRKKQFKCGECLKMFRYEIVLAQHIYSYHNGPLPYPCTLCTERYAQKNQLEEHLQTHQGTKPYNCGSCDAEFNKERQLRKHMAVVHNMSPLNSPPLPPLATTRQEGEKEEERVRVEDLHGDMPAAQESAAELERASPPASVRDGSEQPLSCQMCDTPFTDKQQLVTHMFQHATATPYKCESCNKQFFYKNGLVDHLKRPKHEECKIYYEKKEEAKKDEISQAMDSTMDVNVDQEEPLALVQKKKEDQIEQQNAEIGGNKEQPVVTSVITHSVSAILGKDMPVA